MQNRYVGDIGDYVKLAILRALSPGYRLGVAWWLYPDEAHNNDGRHIDYLEKPETWRHCDPTLFDVLKTLVREGQRNVKGLERDDILPGARFAGAELPVHEPPSLRPHARQHWFSLVQRELGDTNLLFVDPDNGIAPSGLSQRAKRSGKSIFEWELQGLAKSGRCLVVYHHHTRRKGGHLKEIDHWVDVLRKSGFETVDALRARSASPRVFFLLNATQEIRQRAARVAEIWGDKRMTWHPNKERLNA